MMHHSRAAVAFIAASLIQGRRYTSIFDYTEGKYISFSGNVSESSVNVYDYGQKSYITGRPNNLYHYGDAAHIQLKVDRQSFNGYDYKTSSHYSGTVRGSSVSLYDYQNSRHHAFSVS